MGLEGEGSGGEGREVGGKGEGSGDWVPPCPPPHLLLTKLWPRTEKSLTFKKSTKGQ